MGYRSKNAIIVKSALVVGDPTAFAATATGTGVAFQPVVTSNSASATAERAAGTGAANQPSVTSSDPRPAVKALVIQPRDMHPQWRAVPGALILTAPIGDGIAVTTATGTGVAHQPSVTSDSAPATAGRAAGTGVAFQPAVTISAAAGVAAGVGAANQPTAKISPTVGRAAGTGVANQPVARIGANAGRAAGTGVANQANATTPGHAVAAAGVATGVGAAQGATTVARLLNFTHLTVTRDYDLADGAGPSGTVYFTPSAWLRNNGVTIPTATVAAPLDTNGRLSIALASNTDPATTPAGSYYTVREEIVGQAQRSYRITIPSDAGGFTVDLGYLEVIDPPGGGYGIGYGTGYGIGYSAGDGAATTVHAGVATGIGAAPDVSVLVPSLDGGYGVGGYGTQSYGD